MDAAEAAALTVAVALEMAGGTTDAHTRYVGRGQRTYRHDNPHLVADGAIEKSSAYGISKRMSGGALARFVNEAMTEPAQRSTVALRPDNPALIEGRTIHPGRVFDAGQMPSVLISGRSNAKIGAFVVKGPWAGFPIYILTLEERATCPRSCAVWDSCYGNGMPSAVRFRYDNALICRLNDELAHLSRKHSRGFVVRVHVLGDFPDLEYVRHWAKWSNQFKALHVWGYTAHPPASPIGQRIAALNASRPTRWQVRFSVAPEAAPKSMQAAVIWEKPEHTALHDGALVCPQELGKTQTCGTCGICWKPELAHVRILFLGHGGRGKKAKCSPTSDATVVDQRK